MQSKEAPRKKLYEKISALCELPQDIVSDIPVFIMRGRHEIEIDGCSGILEYDGTRVVVAIGRDKFTVTGSGLTLSDFRYRVLYIRGNIESANFGADGGTVG